MEYRSQENQPPVAITMGCPVGIGPEIICKLFYRQKEVTTASIILGDLGVMKQTAASLALPLEVAPWTPGSPLQHGVVSVLQVGQPLALPVRWGHPDADTGRAMGHYIEEAVRLVGEDTCSAIVTCPISKTSLHQAGYPYPGHTEMLAALTQTQTVRMMMAGPRLRVVLVTIHVALQRVSGLLSEAEIKECIRTTCNALKRDFGIVRPRIAVCGLNPHAGEQGMFGDEEQRLIAPAIAGFGEDAEVTGPWPPDTVFHKAAAGGFDAVVAMYHDQGLIPFKLIHFADGVNVTLGLPLVRTSVDHGTAYDIAGTNQADPTSLQAALAMAHSIVSYRRQWRQP